MRPSLQQLLLTRLIVIAIGKPIVSKSFEFHIMQQGLYQVFVQQPIDYKVVKNNISQ